MNEERDKVRCQKCELVQWRDRQNCRRCGTALPEPIVKLVERVVERIVVRHDAQCIENLEQARQLLAAASERLAQSGVEPLPDFIPVHTDTSEEFPTMAEMERAMVVAAYQRSNRRPLEAARLLGIGKTTFYRKLREMKVAA